MVVLLDWNQDYFKVLDELTDLLPNELPKLLSLRRAIDHQIKLVPGIVPFASTIQNRTSRVIGIDKQLRELLNATDCGRVQPVEHGQFALRLDR